VLVTEESWETDIYYTKERPLQLKIKSKWSGRSSRLGHPRYCNRSLYEYVVTTNDMRLIDKTRFIVSSRNI